MKHTTTWRRWTSRAVGVGLALGFVAAGLATATPVAAQTVRPAPEQRHWVPPSEHDGHWGHGDWGGRGPDWRWRHDGDPHWYRPYGYRPYGYGPYGYRPYGYRPYRPGYWYAPAPGQWVWNGWNWTWVPGD